MTGAAQLTGVTAQKSPNEAAIDGLIAALKDSDAGVRKSGRDGARRNCGASAPFPALIEALKDPQTDVRLHVIIGAWRDRGSCGRRRRLIAGVEGYRAAAFAPGRPRPSPSSATVARSRPLIAAVKDSNVNVRKQALMALAEIRDDSALTAITAALKDEDASVRRAAAMALAELSGGDWHDGSRPHPHPHPHPQSESEPESESESRPQPGGVR